MTRSELRDDLLSQGWTEIAPVAEWRLQERTGNARLYRVPAFTPDGRFVTGQVLVMREDTPQEEARPHVYFEEQAVSFREAARAFLDEKESSISSVYTIRMTAISSFDEVAEVMVYFDATGEAVTAQPYVITRRPAGNPAEGAFSFKEIQTA